jgi:hypothetical protein
MLVNSSHIAIWALVEDTIFVGTIFLHSVLHNNLRLIITFVT